MHTIQIAFDKLKNLIGEAYESGYRGSLQMKEQEIDGLLEKYEVSSNGGFRIWTIEELREMPVGTLFDHLAMGRCFIESRLDRHIMQFNRGEERLFNHNGNPWDIPMKLVFKP
jgi:hypothetical protein